MRCRIYRLLLATTAALALSTLPALALLASADVNGNCSATINGADVRSRSSNDAGDAIEVKEHTAVPVTMQSADGITHLRVQLEFAGFRWTVRDEPTSGTSWENSVPVDKYAKYGVGLYKVIGQSDGPAGKCSGSALVRVLGNPLTTVAGAVGAGITALGAAGLVVAGTASALGGQAEARAVEQGVTDGIQRIAEEQEANRQREMWQRWEEMRHREEVAYQRWRNNFCPFLILPALLLTGAAMAAGPGAPPAPKQGVRLPRAGWRPRISVVGLIGGLLAGAGAVVLLQQYAVVYPTRAVAIEGLVAGLALGLVLPSLLRFFAVWRVNKVIARAERRLNKALALRPRPATGAGQPLEEAPAGEQQPQPPPTTTEVQE